MSNRPGSVRKHRRTHGEVVALKQWEKKIARNPKEMAKPDITEAMLLILRAEPSQKMPKNRMVAMLYLLSQMKAIRAPKPSKSDLVAIGRRLLCSDDPDDINLGSVALNAAGAWGKEVGA